MRSVRFSGLIVGLALLAPGAPRADVTYQIQPIAKLGDTVGDVRIMAANGYFAVGALNDSGQLIVKTAVTPSGGDVLFQYADGKLTPIVRAGQEGPAGNWPQALWVRQPVSMNALGNVVFAANVTVGSESNSDYPEGTFLWDFKAQTVTPVALIGMPAVHDLTFDSGGGGTPVINREGEIALVAQVKSADGNPRHGIFFRGRDGTLTPVALPDQELPDGRKVEFAAFPSLNDAGVVAFVARRQGDGEDAWSAYLWEKGVITPVAATGSDTPDGRRLASIWGVRVNNKNRNVLVLASLNGRELNAAYLFADGKLTPVAVPGQEMPEGGTFRRIQHVYINPGGVSVANDAGQHVLLAVVAGVGTAAYLMEADGSLSLILKSGPHPDLAQITNVGQEAGGSTGVGFNNKGQVALVVKPTGVPATVVLLTPTVP